MKQNEPILILMRGLPCSGKTEWARRWVKSGGMRVRLSWTECLKMMGERSYDQARLLAFEMTVHAMIEALKMGVSVVLDELNLVGAEWGIFSVYAQQLHVHVEVHNMHVSREDAQKENIRRGCPYTEAEIDRWADLYAPLLKQK